VPTDAYGYQEVDGDGSYDPNIASDGTDLTNAVITPDSNPKNCCKPYGCTYVPVNNNVNVADSWTIIGQYDNNWADQGLFTYTANVSSNIGSEIGIDGKDFKGAGYDIYSTSTGLAQEEGNDGAYESHQVAIYMKYQESKWAADQNDSHGGTDGVQCYWYDQWDEKGITKSPAGHYILLWNKIWTPQNQVGRKWRTDGCTAFQNAVLDIPNSWWYDEP
jgi:hypothetical protein